MLHDRFGELKLRLLQIIVGKVDIFPDLGIDCLDDGGMLISQGVHRKSRKHIEIAFSVLRVEVNSVPSVDLKGDAFIGMKKVLRLPFECFHGGPSGNEKILIRENSTCIIIQRNV